MYTPPLLDRSHCSPACFIEFGLSSDLEGTRRELIAKVSNLCIQAPVASLPPCCFDLQSVARAALIAWCDSSVFVQNLPTPPFQGYQFEDNMTIEQCLDLCSLVHHFPQPRMEETWTCARMRFDNIFWMFCGYGATPHVSTDGTPRWGDSGSIGDG